ncbi:hypothetical protein ASC66_01300 [Leifsonia sp. Root4]|uniref:hypothetical protein n=1 Tax=Leifsonia sp. Root4 TaxID=1736525 RepID=UPI000700CDEA|nr:hypothetical protein [Leifsonia sp. Root4]KQW07665.1 hypothetical protein ASC66_01300 [Leifsonia sp. Root4]
MDTTTATPANYWRARIERERAVAITPARDYDDVWFGAGLAGILALALLWAWAPTLEHGSVALGYSLFWSGMWVTLVITAWVDVHRFDRATDAVLP